MDARDPFAAITELCRVSSSQEERLHLCRFAGEEPNEREQEKDSEESPAVPVESTGIMMMSPPESSEHGGENDDSENDDNTPKENDIFQTAPEGSEISGSDNKRNDGRVVLEEEIAAGGETAVDLGADDDLGFSELELTQRFETVSQIIQSKLNKVRALKRNLGLRECLSEIPYKKSKLSDKNPCVGSPNQCLREILNYNKDSPYNCDKSPQSNQNSEASGRSSAKRKLQFSTEVLDSEAEVTHRDSAISEGDRAVCNNGNSKGISNSGQKSIGEINKYRYVRPSACNSSKIERTQAARVLPVSICGRGDKDADKGLDSGNHCGEMTLLDVLRLLASKCDYDHSLESRSILDVAKSRGLTFP